MSDGGAERPGWRAPAAGLALSLGGAVTCDLVLEWSTWLTVPATWYAPFFHLAHFLVGAAYLWVLIALLTAVTGRALLSLVVMLSVSSLIAVANVVKLSRVAEPIVYSDLAFVTQPGFLLEMTSPGQVAAAVSILLATGWAIVAVVRRPDIRPFRLAPRTPVRVVASATLRTGMALALGYLVLQASTFSDDRSNPWRMAFNATGVEWKSWDALDNYLVNGFIGGFLYSLPVDPMPEPAGYSESSVASAVDRLPAGASADASAARPHIVVVLCESCSDPARRPGVELATDPWPNLHRLQREAWSGELVNWQYGTGTSVMEYEVLTGLSAALFAPQVTAPYASVVAPRSDVPSAVGWLEHLGYDTTAIHTYRGSVYRRTQAYRSLGFDTFLDESDLSRPVRLGPWISDATAFDHALETLRDATTPQFVHVITMQNHTPASRQLSDPAAVGSTDVARPEVLGSYVRLLSETDRALGRFIDSVEDLDEPTTVLFFGDHLPPFYDPAHLGTEPPTDFLRTPFMVWSSDRDLRRRDLGTTSATALMPIVLRQARLPAPPFYGALARQRRELGDIGRTHLTSRIGARTPLDALDDRQQHLLDDLRLIQYDLSVGAEYSREQLWQY